jgi:thiamine biosynthesis lipoprotein
MGTMATVRVWAGSPATADLALEAAFASFDRVDSLMSTWRDDSVLAELNRARAGQWTEVGPEVAYVLGRALEVARISGGGFDPTVLPLVRLWGFRNGGTVPPDSAAIVSCLEAVDYRQVEIDEVAARARLLKPGMAVDLGGIAKGYALDLAAAGMRKAGADGGYLDLGGNILVFGQGPAGRVAVADPRDRGEVLAVLPLRDGSVATSGQYERFLLLEGRTYGHILDPRTGWPVRPGFSVTVLAGEAVLADALATAAVVLGTDEGFALLESAPDVEAMAVIESPQGDLTCRSTSGLVLEP